MTSVLKALIIVTVVLMVAGSITWVLFYRGTSELAALVESINVDRNKRTIIIQQLQQEDIDIKRRLETLENPQ